MENSINRTMRGLSLIRLSFLAALVIISGCASTQTRHQDKDSIIETAIVYENGPGRTPQFSFSDSAIKLEYRQEVLGFTQDTISTTRDHYERKYGGFFANYIDTDWHKTISEDMGTRVKRSRDSSERKIETRIPDTGSQIILAVEGTKMNAVSGPDGTVILDEALSLEILKAGKDEGSFKKIRIEIPALKLSGLVDISEAGFIVEAVSKTLDLVKAAFPGSINTLENYQAFARAASALKPQTQYPFQLAVLRQRIEKERDLFCAQLAAEKGTIETAIPQFFIRGEILDTYATSNSRVYEIWGTSFPIPQNDTTLRSDGFRNARSNMNVVIHNNIETENINQFGVNIVIERGVYYIARDSGRNSMGQSVPIFVFSNNMEQVPGVGNRKQRLDTINIQLRSAREISSQYMAELQ